MYKHSNNQLTPSGSNRFAAFSEDFVPMTQEQVAKHIGAIETLVKESEKVKKDDKKKKKN